MEPEQEKFKDGKYLTRRAKEVLSGCVVVFVLIFIFSGGNPQSIIGWQKTPGRFFEKRFYQGKYYVYVSKNKSNTKQYKLPADIDRHIHCDPDNDCGSLSYYLSQFYWPNGGYASFDDDSCAVGLPHVVTCTDTNGDTYDILMTSEAVK
jgi:hypothetical protein